MKKALMVLLFFSFTCFGWSELAVKYMIVNAYKTLPTGLKLYLDNNKRDILRGAESVNAKDFNGIEDVKEFVCKEQRKIAKMIKERKKIKKVAFEFGRLFKAIAILSYPFAFETSFYSRDYNNYLDFKLEKFIFAFERKEVKDFKVKNCKKLVSLLVSKSSESKEKVLNDYKVYEDSSNFDDLSSAFGCGSLMFSYSCFTMSEIATSVWLRANGKIDGCLIVK